MHYQNCVGVWSHVSTLRLLDGVKLISVVNSPSCTDYLDVTVVGLGGRTSTKAFRDSSLVGMEAPYGLAFPSIGSHWLTKCGGLDLAVWFTQGIFK